MTKELNLREIEKKAYTSYHQDGLIDIFAGCLILGFSVWIILDMSWMGWILFTVVTSIYAAAKRVFTIPRIGFVKFRGQRTKVAMGVFVGLLSLSSVLGIVTFMQFEDVGTPPWLLFAIEYYMPVIGVIIASLFCVGGYTFRTQRMYAYALLTLATFIPGHFLYFPLHYYLTLLGTPILLVGLVMLIGFVRRYPLSTTGAMSGNSNGEQ